MKSRVLSVLSAAALMVVAAAGCKPSTADKEPKKPEGQVEAKAPEAGKPAEKPATPPDSLAVKLLAPTDLAQVIQGELRGQLLQGIPQSDSYASFRYSPITNQSEYGVAIQVWKLGGETEARYDKDLASYPAAAAKDEVGSKSFRGYRDGIMYVHFMDKDAGAVVSLTCGVATCSPGAAADAKPEDLKYEPMVALAKVAQGRLATVK